MKLVKPVTVTLENWWSPTWGDRWSIQHEGRSLQVCGTEFEARRYCREQGWTIDEDARHEGWG